jgi:hypothetical protein
MGTIARRRSIATAAGFTIGVILGYVVGLGIRSDNLPFFAAIGAVIGLCIGLAIGFALDRGHVEVGQENTENW